MYKRTENEKKFKNWLELDDGGRYYYYFVEGHYGWKAKYVKIVDKNEATIKFYQEIYNNLDVLVEYMKNIQLIKDIRRYK
jgi:hypothetical protein